MSCYDAKIGKLLRNINCMEIGDSAIGRRLNWPTVHLADPIKYYWMSVKIFSILQYSYISHRIKLDEHQKFVSEHAH